MNPMNPGGSTVWQSGEEGQTEVVRPGFDSHPINNYEGQHTDTHILNVPVVQSVNHIVQNQICSLLGNSSYSSSLGTAHGESSPQPGTSKDSEDTSSSFFQLPLLNSAFRPLQWTMGGDPSTTITALGMSLFTVEQLELIRRLRCTGITPDAVIEAFRTLDQIENDLDQARAQSAALAALIAPTTKLFDQSVPPHSNSAPVTSEAASQSPILLQHLRSQPPVPVTISASSPALCSSPERITVQTVPLASTASDSALLQGYESSSSGCRPIRSQRTPMKEITTLDDPAELEEFMQQGEEGCIGDMKQFITQYSLRQTTVAMMTGVSQPYISKLLNGNHRELSLRCRKNIYSWYLNCRRHPEKLSAFLADPSSRLETNGDGELVPQRRERYVFRPILIRMLESFFSQTPFPDLNRRIEIATACNHALQLDKKGVGLMPKEVVSPQVVANWFANKRKELRRKSNEEAQASASGNSSVGGLTLNGLMPLSNASSQDNMGSTPHETTASCSEDGELTPSPLLDEMNCEDSQNTPIDMAALAQRLGFQFPLPVSLPSTISHSSEDVNLPPVTMASLASQLFQSGFPCLPQTDSELQLQIPIPTSLGILRPEVSRVSLPTQEEMLNVLYPSTLHQQLMKMEQTAE